MKVKGILMLIFGLLLLYPVFSLFQLDQAISMVQDRGEIEKKLLNYQISIWISWVFMAAMAIYYKWTRKRNLFFTATYCFLILAFMSFGIYTQKMVLLLEIPTRFEDTYTLGVFTAVQHILISVILTGFLQAAVWWFTRRWHRR